MEGIERYNCAGDIDNICSRAQRIIEEIGELLDSQATDAGLRALLESLRSELSALRSELLSS